jgi:hypothetical protein
MNPSEDFKMKKETKKLQDLLESITSYLEPNSQTDQVKGLYDTKLAERLYGEKPECFVGIRGKGADISTLLPICNRGGIQDPRIIQFSIQMAKKLQLSDKVGLVDPASLKEAISLLEGLSEQHKKPSKGIDKIKDYLKETRGQ